MLLSELSDVIGISGDETTVRTLIASRIRPFADRLESDAMGNLYAYQNWDASGPRRMVAAHMDEVGLIVSQVTKSGHLRVKAIGGVDARVLPGAHVVVGGDHLPGVIGIKPIHLKSGPQSAPELDDLYIDIGAADEGEAKGKVHVGDPVGFATKSRTIGQNRFAGKALDDRAGCAVLVELLKQRLGFPLCAVFTVQEEIGLRGARAAAYTVAPDVALVLETTTCADLPEVESHLKNTIQGEGAVITLVDGGQVVPEAWVRRLREAAVRDGIAHQFKRTQFGGTDGGAVHLTREGVPTGVLSIPGRFIHAPCSIIDLGDMAAVQALAAAGLAAWN